MEAKTATPREYVPQCGRCSKPFTEGDEFHTTLLGNKVCPTCWVIIQAAPEVVPVR